MVGHVEYLPFTVFVRQSNGRGTTYITCREAPNIEVAKTEALADCSQQWGGWDIDGLIVIGVAAGDVEILEWDDCE